MSRFKLPNKVMNMNFRVFLGFLISVLMIIGVGQFLVTDTCLDMGGIIQEGVCFDESYHEVHYAVSVPVVVMAIGISLSITATIAFILGKVLGGVK